MSQPYEEVVFYIRQGLEPESFWDRLRNALSEHQIFFRPGFCEDSSFAVSADSTLDVFKQLEQRHPTAAMTPHEWENIAREKFLTCQNYVWITNPWVEDWEGKIGPNDLWITKLPPEIPWAYHVQINCSFYRIRKYSSFWERIIDLSKMLFVSLSADFGFACFEDMLTRHLEIFRGQKALTYLPTLPGSVHYQLQILRQLFPNLTEDEIEEWLQPSDRWGGQFPWGGPEAYVPASFYLLSCERYEASKPHLPNLSVEAIERFPHLQGYGVQRIEELPNGGAFIFLGYPYEFDDSK